MENEFDGERLEEPPIAKGCNIKILFERDRREICRELEGVNLNNTWAFLNPPFLGRLEMRFEGSDIMNGLSHNRNKYPAACAYWLAKSFQFLVSEEIPDEVGRDWLFRHRMYHALGDYSPEITFYKDGGYVIVEKRGRLLYRINPVGFGLAVDSSSGDLLEVLEMCSKTMGHKKTKELKESRKNNFELLKRLA